MDNLDEKLSELLRKSRVSPALPPRFEQNVWRRIETADAPVRSESWLDALATLVMRPRFAVASVVVLLAAGMLMGTLEGTQTVRHDAQMRYLASVAPESVR